MEDDLKNKIKIEDDFNNQKMEDDLKLLFLNGRRPPKKKLKMEENLK